MYIVTLLGCCFSFPLPEKMSDLIKLCFFMDFHYRYCYTDNFLFQYSNKSQPRPLSLTNPTNTPSIDLLIILFHSFNCRFSIDRYKGKTTNRKDIGL